MRRAGVEADDRGLHRPVVDGRPGDAGHCPGHDVDAHARPGHLRPADGQQVLIAGLGHLGPRRQVQPELHGVRVLVAERELTVDDAASRGHPLQVARLQRARVADVVAVLEDAVEHDSDGLQAPVRMPLESGLGEPVLGQRQERVGARRVIRGDDDGLVVHLRVGTESLFGSHPRYGAARDERAGAHRRCPSSAAGRPGSGADPLANSAGDPPGPGDDVVGLAGRGDHPQDSRLVGAARQADLGVHPGGGTRRSST